MAAAPDPDEVLRSTDGKANFQRLARLLISGGTSLLREKLNAIHPPSNLPTILSNAATKKQLKAAKLTKPQWDCLYPSPGVYGESTDFDITLLFRLLRTICSLIPPATGWDALPDSTDQSLTADLARIKHYRNSIYGHVSQNMEIPDDRFLTLWQEISDALLRIAADISDEKKTAWQGAMKNLRKDPLTPEDERNVQELEAWYENDADVKKGMNQLTTTVQDQHQDIRKELNNTTQVVREEHQDTRKEVNTATQVLCDIKDQLGEIHQSIEKLSPSTSNSQSTAARLRLQIDCETIAGPDGGARGMVITPRESQTANQEGGGAPVTSNLAQAVVQGATAVSEVSNDQQAAGLRVGNVAIGDIPSAQKVLNFIALKCFGSVDPSKQEQLNDFVEYMEKVRKVLIVETQSGSLIIVVECSSLQILEELWKDYCTGHLNEMAEKFLVTEDILKKFGLIAVKLTTTIEEKEYRACREYFLKQSATDSPAVGKDDDDSDLTTKQDPSPIVKEISKQFKKLRKSRKKSHDAFLRWIPTRARTMEKLEGVVTKLEEHHRPARQVVRGALTGGALTGGALTGGALTAGALIGGTLIGGALIGGGLIGGAVVGGAWALARLLGKSAEAIQAILETLPLPNVQAAIEEDRTAYSELQQRLDSLGDFISTIAAFLKTLPNDPLLLMQLEGSGFEFLREPTFFIGSSTEERVDFGARFFRAATSVTGDGATRTRTQTTRATHVTGFAIESVLPSLDITKFVKTSLSQPGATTSKAEEDIRGILKELECPKEEEVQGLVEQFIDEKFNEVYYGWVVKTSVRTQTDVPFNG